MVPGLKVKHLLLYLVIIQIVVSLCLTANYVFTKSNLRFLFSPDFSREEKHERMLGPDYFFSKKLKQLPLDRNYLIVSDETTWFLNYYLYPRKLFQIEGVAKLSDIKKVPPKWFVDNKVDYMILYKLPNIRILEVGR